MAEPAAETILVVDESALAEMMQEVLQGIGNQEEPPIRSGNQKTDGRLGTGEREVGAKERNLRSP
jgi:hypothetical protein